MYPNIPMECSQLDSQKSLDGIDTKEYKKRRELLIVDLTFNPTSYHTFVMLGFLNAYKFTKMSETTFFKGQRTTLVHMETSDFDTTLNCMGNALYIIISKILQDDNVFTDIANKKYGVTILSEIWIDRSNKLNRWADANIYEEITNIFMVLFRIIHM